MVCFYCWGKLFVLCFFSIWLLMYDYFLGDWFIKWGNEFRGDRVDDIVSVVDVCLVDFELVSFLYLSCGVEIVDLCRIFEFEL